MSMNTVSLLGRFGRDPELKRTASGISVCSFSIAVERNYANANGERATDWIDCVAWRKKAELICSHFRKGSGVALQGRLEPRTYEDKNGVKHKRMEVVVEEVYFVERSPATGSQPAKAASPSDDTPAAAAPPPDTEDDSYQYGEPEDDLPF